MRSSSRRRALFALAFSLASVSAPSAAAQETARGFRVDRFYPSAPGGGWFVMDALDMRGGLGVDGSVAVSYAHDPLQVRPAGAPEHLTVVSNQSFAAFGFAASYDRYRIHLELGAPLVGRGSSGDLGGYHFTAPRLTLASNPDTLSDARFGFDARLVGTERSAFRFGVGAQLFVPSGEREDYVTDGTYRAMGRALFAGDSGLFTYAGHVGVHVRPRDDAPTPGGPRGSELLFGVAAGLRLAEVVDGAALIVGPELFGATALRSVFGDSATAVEGLLSARIEGTADDGAQLRAKVGAGAGLDQQFGAPAWRLLFAIELFDRHGDRDHDGISDRRDACPDVRGVRSVDPKRHGCPPEP
jgi:hypothetical protein